jgi:tetratricopeptide (TPR) repeat protein
VPAIHINRGIELLALQRHADALASFDRVILMSPEDATAHQNRALALIGLQRYDDALPSLDRALQLAPDRAVIHLARAKALVGAGQATQALASLDLALAGMPDDFDVHFQRGIALGILDRYEDAVASFDAAVALNPGSAEALNNRGALLVRLFRPAEALGDFERAMRINPDYADAYINNGNALRGLSRFPEALSSINSALSIRPDDPTATWSKALLKLSAGEFLEGWPLYEARLRLEPGRRLQRPFNRPRWTGAEPIAGRTLLVWAEQGLGDTLQFCRYIPVLEEMGANVLFEVQPVLKPLLRSLRMRGTLIARGEPLPQFDLHTPLLSLPLALGTTLDSIPAAAAPYLSVDPTALRSWSERLATLPGLRLGLIWQGDTEAEKLSALQARSFPLAVTAPLARLEGVSLVSLQKGAGAEQREQVDFRERVAQLTEPSYMGPDEIATETAPMLKALDLVITADTALAHLAGALGGRVWLVLQDVPDWRWLIGRADSPWYPTMRLFRQRSPGNWAEVFDRMATELAALRKR